jgi:NAD(P)-dependent dehydrogenase (short-subunit alcohol dehydrogenase family)
VDTTKLMYRPGLMSGQRILITGGGTGLGREIAEAFLALGAEIYICGRRGGKLDETAAELMAVHGGKVTGIACDIRDPAAIKAMVDTIWADGALTGLVNNAAGNFISRTEDISTRGFDAISDIVFKGTFYVTLDIGKRLIAQKKSASFLSILTTWVWNQSGDQRHDAESGNGMGSLRTALQRHCAGCLSNQRDERTLVAGRCKGGRQGGRHGTRQPDGTGRRNA